MNLDLPVQFNRPDRLVAFKRLNGVLGEDDPAVLISTAASTARGIVILETLDQVVLVADLAALLDSFLLGPAKVNIPSDELRSNLLGLRVDLLGGGILIASDLN